MASDKTKRLVRAVKSISSSAEFQGPKRGKPRKLSTFPKGSAARKSAARSLVLSRRQGQTAAGLKRLIKSKLKK